MTKLRLQNSNTLEEQSSQFLLEVRNYAFVKMRDGVFVLTKLKESYNTVSV